ncbi:MAG: OmpA family protein [Gemmatimonas sp.]
MLNSRLVLVLLAVPVLALGACKKKKPVPEVVPTSEQTPPMMPARPPETANTAPIDNSADAARRLAAARETLLRKIYFEYNADELRDDSKANLDEKIRILNANPGLRIRVAGHCDERGNDEYNIVLGRRRAEAAKRYLTDRGIDASRIETTSFGRERPAVQGSGEEAWSQNRRDEFEITAGGDQLRAP